MAKIIGIDLGTTYSAVSIWDEKKKVPYIIPNLSGFYTTPSIVSLNKAGEVIIGEEARRNQWANPKDTVSEIKREMGKDFTVSLGGQIFNPQSISAFILSYLKRCAEQYLGEPVYDAVITVPAYFKEVQRSATREAGEMAGLNVARLISEPTAAAIAYGVSKPEEGEKTYAVYDLGGGTFDVSIIKVTSDDVTVVGTGGDMHLGGLDMDELVMKWALHEIKKSGGPDLSGDDTARRRLKVEAEGVKKALVISESTTLNVPMLTIVNNQAYNVDLPITRARFELMITPLLERSLVCLEQSMASAKEHNQVEWEDLDGILLVGGPTRLHKIRSMLRDKLKEHCPDKEPVVKSDLNPDEVVAMGAAVVAFGIPPIGKPPEEFQSMSKEKQEKLKEEARNAAKASEATTEAPKIDIYDVTGHSLGIALEGTKFHRIIDKETPIPVSIAQAGFGPASDYTPEVLVEVYQGEEEFVAANTKIGEVRINGLEPLPRGQHSLEIKFSLDVSGTLSTICRDMRTNKIYQGTFKFDTTRMSAEEIRKRRGMIEGMMAGGASKPAAPAPTAPASVSTAAPAPAPIGDIPALPLEKIPADCRALWQNASDLLGKVDATKQAMLKNVMAGFASAVVGGDASKIEDMSFQLQDVLVEVAS